MPTYNYLLIITCNILLYDKTKYSYNTNKYKNKIKNCATK